MSALNLAAAELSDERVNELITEFSGYADDYYVDGVAAFKELQRHRAARKAQTDAPDIARGEGAGDWIEWKGGECPVPPDIYVNVRTRYDVERDGFAKHLRWKHAGGSSIDDIIAYRLAAAPNRAGGRA